MKKVSVLLMICVAVWLVGCAGEQVKQPEAVKESQLVDKGEDKKEIKEEGVAGYSPYTKGYPQRVLFGDTHVHTKLSNDAFATGVRLGLEEAYRFARGDEVISSHGEKVRLNQPLDFLVVADHAEAYGGYMELFNDNPKMLVNPKLKEWSDLLKSGNEENSATLALVFANAMFDKSLPKELIDKELFKSLWVKNIEITEKYNDPGRFTAFHGYEWTSTPGGRNLHRVVMFKDGGDKVSQIIPLSAYEVEDPEKLWDYMEQYEKNTGGDVISFAHNGNWSSGTMFDTKTEGGGPLTKAYAERRMKWEPVYEVTQMKGDGEAHPMLSPDDEFADYETWDTSLIGAPLTAERLIGEYGRSGLKRGLELEAQIGANPYKFGLIGSTDTHTGLAAAEEENMFGKVSTVEPSEHRWHHVIGKLGEFTLLGKDIAGSGYAAVWARENTREAIFDAFERKEVYATTGPRMIVRFFGGWDFVPEDAETRFPGETGYKKGVPMGGDLSKAPKGKSPTFLVAALKDVFSGNLDRVQIIKSWLDKDGKVHEKVYDVAVSDGRKIGKDGRCMTPVGNTVNIKKATWTNTIGAPELITVWTDPDFDPKQKAFYYARVIEIPTPRWSAYDVLRYKLKDVKDIKMITQERAYTSPIWYTP